MQTYYGILTCLLLTVSTAHAVDHVNFKREDATQQRSGQIVVEAADGGVLLQDPGGVLWAITADELLDRKSDDTPFRLFDNEELAASLEHEMPPGFRFHKTAHYLICYNTSEAYARWCGALFERLYMAFHTYWGQRGFELDDPPAPLIALIFSTKRGYAEYAREELGDATNSVIGYYSLRSNRVTMYDLTGVDAFRGSARASSADHINRILAQPQAERTVATIIHEATHQLAFNCGLQTRYADIPLWVSEGIAIYFETPDLRSRRGWRTIGGVNRIRFSDFARYAPRRPRDSLTTLLADDERFRRTELAPNAYAEAWALNYFLIRRHKDAYIQYLKKLSKKPPLLYDEPQERIDEFREAFGMDLMELDQQFMRYMRSVR
jgi:hypothetical protein